MIIVTDPQLSLVMLAVLPAAAGVIGGLMRLVRPAFTIVQEQLALLNSVVQENLVGAGLVKAFVREAFENERFGASSESYMEKNIKVGRLMAVALPLLTILTNLGIAAVLWYGGIDVVGGRLSIGELVAFNAYLMIGMTPLLMLGNILTMVSRAEASAERVLQVLNTEPVVQPPPTPYAPKQMVGRLRFEEVSFQYDGNGGQNHNDQHHNHQSKMPHTSLSHGTSPLAVLPG